MIEHVVLLKLKDEVGDAEADDLVRRLNRLPETIPGIVSYRATRDAGLRPGNAEVAVVARFESEAAFTEYQAHPDHQAVLTDCITPWTALRVAHQTVVD